MQSHASETKNLNISRLVTHSSSGVAIMTISHKVSRLLVNIVVLLKSKTVPVMHNKVADTPAVQLDRSLGRDFGLQLQSLRLRLFYSFFCFTFFVLPTERGN